VVWFHDGEKSPAPIIPLIASGYAVASVGYRSGQVADALAAVDWLRANAATYSLDASHIALAGNDKGGQIASIAGKAGGVQAVVAIYPAADQIAQPAQPASAGPSPAFLVMHGTADTVVPVGQSEKLVFDLKAAGADASLEYVPRAGHDIRQMVTPATTEIIANFLDRTLRSNTHERAAVTSFPLPNDAWEDPLAFDTRFTLYKSYPTPVRGVNARGSYRVYLPPDYNDNKSRRYPVIYYLHGANESATTAAEEANYVQRLDAAIRAKLMPPAVVILVQAPNRAFYIDSKDGAFPVESVIIKNLVPHVDATYRTIARREGRAIEGHSMGGFGALRLAFKYPELFASVSSFAAALVDAPFGGDAEYFKTQAPAALLEMNAAKLRGRTMIRLIVGDKDNLQVPNRAFDEALTRMNVPHQFHISTGAPHSVREVIARLDVNPFEHYARAFASLPK
jgi:endo-1,4-beta-xylanase